MLAACVVPTKGVLLALLTSCDVAELTPAALVAEVVVSAAVVAPEETRLEAVLALGVVLAIGGGEAWWFRLADVTCTLPHHRQKITHRLCLLSQQAHPHNRQGRMLFFPACRHSRLQAVRKVLIPVKGAATLCRQEECRR